MRIIVIITMLSFGLLNGLAGQPNCQYYLMTGDTCQYNACQIATAPIGSQGSRSSQIKLDEAIATCPSFAYAYKVKSIPFLKRGYFIEWKRLMDLAVKYDPVGQLGYRGWCRYQFLRDYEGAIADFEALGKLQSDLGFSANGHYHLSVAKAICQDALGDYDAALATITEILEKPNYYIGLYDYLHLGMIHLHLDDPINAITALELQLEQDKSADVYYYLAKAWYLLGDATKAKESINEARRLYDLGYYRTDPYGETQGRVYNRALQQLEDQISAE